ncbi:TPM domain-containing protein [uncultured Enterococcus sp.]|uniref:TPM domain-containing protein n=1 Tax=uncultured Enterococcus sp. TaxID=167972 RepID=UPI00280538E5|nr:TPM domain-containing protein [uncultured Enterococcus sp.]
MKKICSSLTLLATFLFLLLALPVYGATGYINDEAQLFSPEQTNQLNQEAEKLGQKIKGGIYIVTTDTNEDEPRSFANEYLRDKVGNNQNGAVFLIDLNQREMYVAPSGNMIDYLTDSRREEFFDTVSSDMSNGNYYAASTTFLSKMTDYVNAGIPGGHYRIDEETGKITYYKTITLLEGVIAFALALVASVAFFVIVKSRYQLKLGTYKYPFKQNTQLELTENENRLINSFVTTRRIPRNNSSGGGGGGGSTTNSSGGGTFGGGGRGF